MDLNMDSNLYSQMTEAVDETHLIKLLTEMISIKSENPFASEPRPGFREKEMAQFLAETMDSFKLDVSLKELLPGRPNVFGLKKGTGGGLRLMLAGHTDTMPTDGYEEAYQVKCENGRVYGRGACDMKAGLAAYMEVLRVLDLFGINLGGDLLIAGIIDEESKMIGSKRIGASGPRADQGLIGEPTELDICTANKGQLGTIVRTLGTSVHASIPEKGRNAVVYMASVIAALSDYNEALLAKAPHPLLGHGRCSPNVIKGGSIVSTVPDVCELEVDRRILPGEAMEDFYHDLRRRLEPLKASVPGFDYELAEPTWDIPANDISPREPVVTSLISAYKQVLGKSTRPKAFVAATDAPNLGFPTVVCGPGSIDQAHGTNEFVSVEQLVNATRMYLRVVLELLA
jgi:acetylornithine deacetylase